jgi:hypothetical protein
MSIDSGPNADSPPRIAISFRPFGEAGRETGHIFRFLAQAPLRRRSGDSLVVISGGRYPLDC